jgi:hypothetical protein
MSFLNKLFGYPNDRLTPIASFNRKEDGVMKFFAEYREGKYRYLFELHSPGSTVEEWGTTAMQMQVSLILFTKKYGQSSLFLSDQRARYDNRDFYKYQIFNRIGDKIEDPFRENDLPVKSSLIVLTDRGTEGFNSERVGDELLEFLKLTSTLLVQMMMDKLGMPE